jgi:rifampicin phosphotransferase
VAFTAHPVPGDRDQMVVTAVAGLGERLVSGEAVGEEWTITARDATVTRPTPAAGRVLTAGQAQVVADLARRVADRYGRPQDIEWAVDPAGQLWPLQARPMTALPGPVCRGHHRGRGCGCVTSGWRVATRGGHPVVR